MFISISKKYISILYLTVRIRKVRTQKYFRIVYCQALLQYRYYLRCLWSDLTLSIFTIFLLGSISSIACKILCGIPLMPYWYNLSSTINLVIDSIKCFWEIEKDVISFLSIDCLNLSVSSMAPVQSSDWFYLKPNW